MSRLHFETLRGSVTPRGSQSLIEAGVVYERAEEREEYI